MAWLQPPEEARWLLIGVPPLRPPPGASRVLQREGPLTPGQLTGSPAFDAALLFFAKDQEIVAEQVALARAWLAPGALLAVVLRPGAAVGLRGDGEGPPRGDGPEEPGCGGLREARGLPLALALALRALRWRVLAGRAGCAGDEGNRRVSPV